MKKILILANENERAAVSCLRSLEHADVDIYIAFSERRIKNYITFKSYISKDIYYYSNKSKDQFINSLLNIQKRIGDFFLFNFGDSITRWSIEERKKLALNGVDIKSPNLSSFDLMLNKHSFIECCLKYQLDVPLEIAAEIYLKNNFKDKFVIKAKLNEETYDDSILKSPLLIENKKSWIRLKNKKINIEKHFVQEYIEGPSIYYCALYSSGYKVTHFVQKNVVQQPGGKSVIKAVPSQLPERIIDRIDNMMLDMDWEGIMMIEFKELNGKFYAIECNPRLWGPLQLAIDNGIDFPSSIVDNNTQPKSINDTNDYGYLWMNGFLLGVLYMFQTKTKFQIHSHKQNKKLIYKDVWVRRDTFLYSILEFPIMLLERIKK
ncbi:hypothetical protein ACXYMX_15490 [Sporosarcina sp. CAU 1771]